MPEYIDIHSHISFPDFDADREEVIGRMKEKKVWAIDVGTDLENSRKASENATANQSVFSSAGLHPTDKENKVFDSEVYKKLFANPKVVAVGECGLDYFRGVQSKISNLPPKSDPPQAEKSRNFKERQREIFEKQIEMALELDKPLMIHCRDAYNDLLEILRSYSVKYSSKLRGNMHFFAGSWNEAKNFLDLGFTLSFTGVITFARDYDEVIKNAPLSMLLTETDAPYVTPVPHRGKRNEPAYVERVAQSIAKIRGEDEEAVSKTLVENATRVFRLEGV